MGYPIVPPSPRDRDDPRNYRTFDEYLSSAAGVWSLQRLARRWNETHTGDRVLAHGDLGSRPAPVQVDDGRDCGITRVFAALQLVGGGLELIVAGGALLAPEPTGATKVVGAVVLVHGIDTLQASARTILTCNRSPTFTQTGAASVARFAGASPHAAETIGVITDVGVGAAGSFAVGALTRVSAGAGQLVHLTAADSAAAIRASQTLGLGRSTIYAGPEALARARGWSIIVRTGLRPGQATDVILLPSQANRAFLVIQPVGPFSIWQRSFGTVYSAGAGAFNLTTGTFSRMGAATNQLFIYGLDSAIIATLRTPAAAGAAFNQ
jgi:hypothetical protein